MPGPRINGFTVAYTAVGGLVLWSGIAGTSVSAAVKGALAGQSPSQLPQTEPITTDAAAASGTAAATAAGGATAAAGDTGASTASAAANQAIAKVLAAPYGWSTGTEWTDLVSLWNQESGWNNTADNPSSGAYGIVQALPPTKLPAAAQASGGSSASAQISWGLAYIKATYGSPSAAWAHEVSEGYY